MPCECKFFTWTEWTDEVDDDNLYFYNVELIVPIGDFPVGSKFNGCLVDTTESKIIFYDGKIEYVFELNYSIGKRLD
jgi:hypothetical protein